MSEEIIGSSSDRDKVEADPRYWSILRLNLALGYLIAIEHDDADLGTHILSAMTAIDEAKRHILGPPIEEEQGDDERSPKSTASA